MSPPSPGRPWSAGRTSPARWRPAGPSRPPIRRSPGTGSPTAAAPTSTGTRSNPPARSAWSARPAASPSSPTPARIGDLLVTDEQIAGLAAAGLAGVEVFHPDQPEAEQASLLGLTRDLGLIATGGSDDHGSLTGHRIGSYTAAPGAYESLIAQATGSQPVRSG